MRVLQVTPYFGEQYGGTERYCFNLSRALAHLGVDVQVFAAQIDSRTPLKEEIAGVRVTRFPSYANIWNVNPLSFMLRRLVGEAFDLIHIHSYLYFSSNQAVMAKIIRSILRRKTVLILHLHGGLGIPPYMNHQAFKRIAKSVYDRTIGRIMMIAANHILSACRTDAEAAIKQFRIPEGRVSIVYNGIESDSFANHSVDNRDLTTPPYTLFVGDLEYWKGILTLVESMRILTERGEKMVLKIAGAGSLEKRIREMANGLDVEFLGSVPHSQIPKLMASAFAVVLPSLWEGIPTVGLEAMAAGTPFLGSNVGGIPEIVTNDVTGLLVPPNDPVQIANALQRLQEQRLRRSLTRNAAKLVQEKFSIEVIAKKTVKVYERILSNDEHPANQKIL